MLKWESARTGLPKAYAVGNTHQAEMVEEVKEFMERNPEEPFFFTSTGDTLVVGLRCTEDGEVTVYNAAIRSEEFAIEKRPEQPEVKRAVFGGKK